MIPWSAPSLLDFIAYLESANVDTSDTNADLLFTQLKAAQRDFENASKWSPFVQEEEASVAYYDAPDGRRLFLPVGYGSLTEIKVGVRYQYTGSLLVAERDYSLMTRDVNGHSVIIGIDFYTFLSGGPRSVKVTGIRGVVATPPEDVLLAVQEKAARSVVSSQSSGSGAVAAGLIKKTEQGPVTIEYTTGAEGASSNASRPNIWKSNFESVALQWRKPGIA